MKKVFALMLLLATTLCFYSCSEDDDSKKIVLSQTSYSMYPDASAKIKGSGLSNIIWDSNNEFVAKAEDDMIYSNKVGSATLYCNEHKISVTVKPKYSLYTEPDMTWGCSKNYIISKYGKPYYDGGNTILYQTNNSKVPTISYMFDDRGMYACGVQVEWQAAYELLDFLDERYVFYSVDTSAYTANFAHCYGKIDNPQIDYAGQFAYQSSLGSILLVYAGNTTTRGVIDDSIFESMSNAIDQCMNE